MLETRSIRELAERVEIGFHKRPNRFRRLTWWTGLWLGVVCVVWMAWAAARGDNRIYEAGPMTTAHRIFENDCVKCHTTWGPLNRLISFDDTVRSVDNSKCSSCHSGSAHHQNQIPAHQEISCAQCHREHGADHELSRIADRHCVECHADLKTSDGLSVFARHIERFDADDKRSGHPPFAIGRLLNSDSPKTGVDRTRQVYTLVGFFKRGNQQQAKWQDKAAIRFNHQKHLKAGRDRNGNSVYHLIGTHGQQADRSRSCNACHQPDVDGRYMKPIRYEKHCAECHPLLFDVDKPRQTVPHQPPAVVRGFLTDLYVLSELDAAADADDEPRLPSRPLPGRVYRQLLSVDQAKRIQQRVGRAEEKAQRHLSALFERSGGCRYCHQVSDAPGPVGWKVEPPNIPERWMVHSQFRHDSHRTLNCLECHQQSGQSSSTGDVLLPGIETCLDCHTERLTAEGSRMKPASGFRLQTSDFASNADRSDTRPSTFSHVGGARTDCVECHRYHNASEELFNGRPQLNVRGRF